MHTYIPIILFINRFWPQQIMDINITEMSCENATNSTDDGYDRSLYEYWSVVLLGIFACIGTVGNIGLLVVVVFTKHLRTAANIMVVNLTVGDLLYLLISAPFHIEHDVHPSWQFGAIACKFSQSGQVAAQGVCVLSLFALSLERHQAITKARVRASSHNMHKTLFIVATIWFLSIMISLPIIILAETKLANGCDEICIFLPHFTPTAKTYVIFQFFALYVLPLAAIAGFYINMARVLLQSERQFQNESQPGARQFIARRRLAIIVLVITVMFGVLWLPYYAYTIWFQFRLQYSLHSIDKVWNVLFFFQQFHFFTGVANSCLNPWVVFVMSSTHRQELLKLLRCRRKPMKTNQSINYEMVGSRKKRVGEIQDISQATLL